MIRTVLFCLPAVVLFASPSLADNRTECRAGIEMIRSEIAKKPDEAT